MYVLKRDGRKEEIMFDKITARIRKLCYGLNELVDPALSYGIYKSYAKIQQNTVEVKYFVYLYSNLVNARFFLF